MEAHVGWLHATLGRDDRRLLVGERDGEPVGTVRWDLEAVGVSSSSLIVPVAWVPEPSVTFVPLLRLTVKLSVLSGFPSSVVLIEITPLVAPGSIVMSCPTSNALST